MKKVIKQRFLIILCLILASMMSIPILASSLPAKNELTIQIAPGKGIVGSTVEVPLQILGNEKEGIWGLHLILYYDEKIMTPVGYSNGEIFPDDGYKTTDASGEYRILCWNEDSSEDIKENGTFGTVTFQIAEKVKKSEFELSANVVQAIKADGKHPNGAWTGNTEELAKKDKLITPSVNGTVTVFDPKTYIPAWETTAVTADTQSAVYNGGETVITLQAPSLVEKEEVKYSYQWYKGEEKLEGKTEQTLELCDTEESGTYKVEVTTTLIDYISRTFSDEVAVHIAKAVPQVSVRKGTHLTYGDALNECGFDQFSSDVEGNFQWADGTIKPQMPDSETTEYEYQFIPADSANYETVSGKTTVKIEKKELVPNLDTIDSRIYNGKTGAAGTISLGGAVNGEMPSASADFNFTDWHAGKNKRVNITNIALDMEWADRYVLSVDTLGNVETDAEIEPKEIGLEWLGCDDLVYRNAPVSAAAAATGLVDGDVCTVIVENGSQINAGTYTAKAVLLDNADYKLPQNTEKVYEIQKADTSVNVSARKSEPNTLQKIAERLGFASYKEKIELTASVLGVPGDSPEGTVSFYDNDRLTAAEVPLTDGQAVYVMENPPAEAGEHLITAKYIPDDSNYHAGETEEPFAFDIDKAVQDALQITSKSEWTYGDGTFSLESSGGEGTGEITYTSSDPEVISIKGSKAVIENAGICLITASKAGDNNYLETSCTKEFVAAKKELTPELDTVESIIYNGGTAASGTVALSGAVNGELPAATAVFNFVDAEAGSNKKVNITEITLAPEWTANYVLTTEKLEETDTTAEIAQKEAGLEWSGYENLVYNAKPVSVTAAASELVNGDTCTVIVKNGSQTDAGTYTAEAESLSNQNYKLPKDTEKTYEIQKADTSVIISARNVELNLLQKIANRLGLAVYKEKVELTASVLGAADDTPEGTVSFYDNGNLLAEHVSLKDGKAAYVMENPAAEAGKHSITAEYIPDDPNYHASETEEPFVFDVDKAVQASLDIITESEWTYGGEPFTIETSGGEGKGAVTFVSSDPDVIAIEGDKAFIVNAGTCHITAVKSGDANYLETSVTKMFSVEKKELIPSLDTAEGMVYNGKTTTSGTISLSGAVNGDEPAATAVFNFTDAKAEKNKKINVTEITLEEEWAANYVLSVTELKEAESEAEISMASIAFIVTDNKYVFNHKAQYAKVTPIVEGYEISEKDYTVNYLKENKKTEPVEAGTYTIQVELNNDSLRFGKKSEDVRVLEIGELVIEKQAVKNPNPSVTADRQSGTKTGDSQNVIPTVTLLSICGIIILITLFKKKKAN